ncbi:MAG: YabP/YqfC family sporulation protein [Bacilli bacterium]|nr:YabP/YqfC family sporulation protein [Bacilli bacterium]
MLRRVYEYVKDEEFRFTVFNDRIHIVNYKKINTLNSDYILIESYDRRIGIKGSNLVLNKMLDGEVLVIGNVKSIEVIHE